MNKMFPHSFSHTPFFSVKLCKFSSQALIPKKRVFGLGGKAQRGCTLLPFSFLILA